MNPMEHGEGFRPGWLRNNNTPGNPNLSRRCEAHRKNGEHCRAPAVRGCRVCRMHGAGSTGPLTAAGLERSRRARWVHGWYSAQAKRERREEARAIREQVRELREMLSSCKTDLDG